MAGSGHSKKHSPLQQAHYQVYRTMNRRLTNKIKKLKHRIRLNEKAMARKAKRNPPRIMNLDVGAINALKAVS